MLKPYNIMRDQLAKIIKFPAVKTRRGRKPKGFWTREAVFEMVRTTIAVLAATFLYDLFKIITHLFS